MTTLVVVFSFNKHRLTCSLKKGSTAEEKQSYEAERVGVGSQISSMNVVDKVGGMLLFVLVVVV